MAHLMPMRLPCMSLGLTVWLVSYVGLSPVDFGGRPRNGKANDDWNFPKIACMIE